VTTFLLDSHTVLWFVDGNPLLPLPLRAIIEDKSQERWISFATAWELGIKIGLRKLKIQTSLDVYLEEHMLSRGIKMLPITMPHIMQMSGLPLHHRDPFDRLLIAQALHEEMTLLSVDENFDAYGVKRVW